MVVSFTWKRWNGWLQDESKPYDSKVNVWVPDAEEGYIAAEIKSTKGDTVTVFTARGNEVEYF